MARKGGSNARPNIGLVSPSGKESPEAEGQLSHDLASDLRLGPITCGPVSCFLNVGSAPSVNRGELVPLSELSTGLVAVRQAFVHPVSDHYFQYADDLEEGSAYSHVPLVKLEGSHDGPHLVEIRGESIGGEAFTDLNRVDDD
jgi:hypothetical protein